MKRATEQEGDSHNAAGIRRRESRRATGRRHLRVLWWIAAGGPPLLAFILLLLERHHPPALGGESDLSAIIFDLSSLLTLFMGVLVAVSTVHRLRNQLRPTDRLSTDRRCEHPRIVREARLRAAWLLLVATLLIILGLILMAIPETALIS